MLRAFDEIRATEAAASFLRLGGGKLHYMTLLGLLYLMDREALLQWGHSITNDKYYAHPRGPILGRVYELIVDEPSPGERRYWADYISEPLHFTVELLRDPKLAGGKVRLSDAEEQLISEIFSIYGSLDRLQLEKTLRQILPEFRHRKGYRASIPTAAILHAGKRSSGKARREERKLEVRRIFVPQNIDEVVARHDPPRCRLCNRTMRRVHRTLLEHVSYMAVYACKECEREEFVPRRFTYHLGNACRCPRCGTPKVVRLKERDHIDPMHNGLLSFLERLAGGRLFHCRYCRLQFYDRRNLGAELATAAPAEDVAIPSTSPTSAADTARSDA
jgi:hypothetical protein